MPEAFWPNGWRAVRAGKCCSWIGGRISAGTPMIATMMRASSFTSTARTSSTPTREEIFDYLSRFTAWRPVSAPGAGQRGRPACADSDQPRHDQQLYGLALNSFQMEEFLAAAPKAMERIATSEDAVVSKVGREIYEKFFRGYTRKQWGLDPSELDAQVTARVPTRTNRDDRYFTDIYQAMPKNGFTRMFARDARSSEHSRSC